MVEELFIGRPRESTQQIWNDTVLPRFNSLSYANLYDYQTGAGYETYLEYGITQWPRYITCNLGVLQSIISGSGGDDGGDSSSCTTSCVCATVDCCDEDDVECINSIEDDSTSGLEERAPNDLYYWNPVNPATGASQDLTWPTISVSSILFPDG
jgi:hypothetical protein